ncbi:DsbC family protein [Fulvimonas soli]|jgi:thiol:disulfide interchange protein DsbC|uniref:Thiol:disulfide interchange protein n=1 Tax=Fulvimonas soli TaxID=155197 RepID=A0A316I6Q0_9GAMM|nr:DsbC family protein [Fulvimonas soli]PWK88664.1 thiol:disulfide interchange protein DsbC [Fulvimonas soli]TNY26796.1 disulfide bond formation protein DsbC [Fulvimonas soli]
MLKRWLPALFAGGFALAACAADGGDSAAVAAVRKAVQGLGPGVQVDAVTPSPLPGFYQVIASGHLVYVSADGKYMLNGDLVDLASRRNVSQDAWAAFRKAELAKLPPGQGIVFAPPNPKYKITVFTDVNCAYCRAFHAHIAEINKEGIAVEYLAWPREGLTTTSGRDTPTYTEMVSVWCAADRKAAFTAAKQGQAPKPASCASPVKDQFNLGVRLGVDGTPTVIAPDGRVLGGFVPPDKLLRLLQDPSAGG